MARLPTGPIVPAPSTVMTVGCGGIGVRRELFFGGRGAAVDRPAEPLGGEADDEGTQAEGESTPEGEVQGENRVGTDSRVVPLLDDHRQLRAADRGEAGHHPAGERRVPGSERVAIVGVDRPVGVGNMSGFGQKQYVTERSKGVT